MSKLNTYYYDHDLRRLTTAQLLFEGECCIRLLARYGMAEEFDIPVPPPPYERIKSRYREVEREIHRREGAAFKFGAVLGGLLAGLAVGIFFITVLYLADPI